MQKDLDKEPVCCETVEVHEDLLRIVEQTMPEETELYDLAELIQGVWGFHPHTDTVCAFFGGSMCV